MIDFFFHPDWHNMLSILITTPLVYILVIVYLRMVGKRAISQMNNFDWIVTVAMGSLVGATIINKEVKLFDGALAIGLLLLMQYVITRFMWSNPRLQGWIKSKPTLLLYEGKFLKGNMKSERILESEIHSAIREKGAYKVEDIQAVILESDAKLSVIPKGNVTQGGIILEEVGGLPAGQP